MLEALAAAGGTILLLGVPGLVAWGNARARIDALEKDVVTLRSEKASKESLEGLRTVYTDLKADLDKRFDRLEQLIREAR